MADKFLKLVNGILVEGEAEHGNMFGLGDDDHAQYLLLAGRSAPSPEVVQTISGGLKIVANAGGTVGLQVTGNSNLQYPILAIGGSAGLGMWKDALASKAWHVGMSIPGTDPASDLLFSHFDGTGWYEMARIDHERTWYIGDPEYAYRIKRDQVIRPGYLTFQGIQAGYTGYAFLKEEGTAYLSMNPATNSLTMLTAEIWGTKNTDIGAFPLSIHDNSPLAQGVGGLISFYGKYTGVSETIAGWIDCYKEDAVDGHYGYALRFAGRTHGEGWPVEKMRLSGTGMLGIGTADPHAVLHLDYSLADPTTFLGMGYGHFHAGGKSGGANGMARITFGETYAGTGVPNAAIAAQFTAAGSKLIFGTSNSYGAGITNQALTLDWDGRVGIGDAISNPKSPLHIDGWVTLQPWGGFSAINSNLYYSEGNWYYVANGYATVVAPEFSGSFRIYMSPENSLGADAVVNTLGEKLRLTYAGDLETFGHLRLTDGFTIHATGIGEAYGSPGLTNYALYCSLANGTAVNAPFGKWLALRINNVDGLVLDANRQVSLSPASALPPLILSANGQGQKVVGFNADELDGLHDNDFLKSASDQFDSFPAKVMPVAIDVILIEDSEDSWNKKFMAVGALGSAMNADRVDSKHAADFFWTSENVNLASGKVFQISGNQVVGARQAHIPDPSGGTTQDAQARSAINSILTLLETHGLMASS